MNLVTEQFNEQDAVTLDRLIKEHSRPNMIVFELGSYTGKSAMTMLPYIQKMRGKLYCVDWFKGNPGVTAEITTSYQNHNIFEIFLNNIKEAGFEDYVTVMVGTSHDVGCIVAQESADFIFIDADHRYTNVKSDILEWYLKLKPGGLICGHDFDKHLQDCDYNRVLEKCEEDFIDGCHYGVTRAVCEEFSYVQWEGRIWYARKGVVEPFRRILWHARKDLLEPFRTVRQASALARKVFPLWKQWHDQLVELWRESEYDCLNTKPYDTVGKRLAEHIELRNRRAKVVYSTAVNERGKETWSETRIGSELKKE